MHEPIKNEHDVSDVVFSTPDEIHPLLRGEGFTDLCNFHTPAPRHIINKLRMLRKRLRWSQIFAASVLGVTPSTITKWETGARAPNGAAAKLIFLLHSQMVEKKDKVRNAWDLATWGQMPCRDSVAGAMVIDIAIAINESRFVEHQDFEKMMNQAYEKMGFQTTSSKSGSGNDAVESQVMDGR